MSELGPIRLRRLRLPTNPLLRSGELGIPLDEVQQARAEALAASPTTQLARNLKIVHSETLIEIHNDWGEEGLDSIWWLASTHDRTHFRHFYDLVTHDLTMAKVMPTLLAEPEVAALLPSDDALEISFDNESLGQDASVEDVKWNVLYPVLSEHVYRPGWHTGWLVYGIGGPRILVSHPFKGVGEVGYDVSRNSLDVVTSLKMRGYHGRFLFLDRVAGLEQVVGGQPAWALWFSLLATHSDLVLFVREHHGPFGPSQELEIRLTPDRVPKKLVEIPSDELYWAEAPTDAPVVMMNGELASLEEWENHAVAASFPHVERYCGRASPTDALIRVQRHGQTTLHPLA